MITARLIGEACYNWVLSYDSHKARNIRFGQYFINTYMPADTVWPELFYETDDNKALHLIVAGCED